METNYHEIYNALQREIAFIETNSGDEATAIEQSFAKAVRYWCEIKKWVSTYSFRNETDEIRFFKYIKPLFISVIEYNTQRYHALLFRPPADSRHLIPYWDHELQRLELFYRQNNDFYQYYTSGKVDRDNLYFVRAKADISNTLPLRPYDESADSATSHDYLVARIRAYSQYSRYVRYQLSTVKK
ncbi:MAG: RteC domain-containing protein [Gemmatimonadaceae bacterium]|nr:RteC domain-containing protein [Chitinophagaceae bacterium]